MAKDIRECLLEQVGKFHQWQEITYPGKTTEEIGGAWEVDYPAWNDIFDAFCHVGARELRALDVLEEVLGDPMWNEEQKDMIRESVNGGHLQCYLFQCLHCGKHLVWMDFD